MSTPCQADTSMVSGCRHWRRAHLGMRVTDAPFYNLRPSRMMSSLALYSSLSATALSRWAVSLCT